MNNYRNTNHKTHQHSARRYEVQEEFNTAKNIYYMYLAGLLTFYISNLIGYMKALKERKNPNASIIMKSHYKYQVKIMHINIALNIICILGTMAYIFYILSGMDFMNISMNEDLTLPFTSAISFWTFSSIASTVLFYIQTSLGFKKIMKKQQV